MNDQPALSGNADAQQIFLSNQVNLFLFDLKNEATEHGFKTSESWKLQIVTEDEIIGLKKEHHPLISLRLQTHALLRVYLQVKSKLQQSLSDNDRTLTEDDLARNDKKHLVAYWAGNTRN